jgi:Uma2 family endonuclease
MQTLEPIASPAPNGTSSAHRFLWDVKTYECACKMGVFEGKRVELIEGEINDLNAHSKPHMAAISRTYDLLREIFPKGSYVLTNQGTLYSSEQSRPEPDIAVFRGDYADILSDDPMRPVLVVEVSLQTLAYDQGDKASFYAHLGVREYWVLNLRDEWLEVRCEPQPMASQRFGAGYTSLQILNRAMSAGPLELPQSSIAVNDLLP